MLILGSSRDKELDRLNLPDNVRRLTRGESVHPQLDDDCRPPQEAADSQVFPKGLDVIPLWEGHSSVTGFYRRPNGAPEFIRYEFEYPDDYVVLGGSIHSVITNLLAWYWTEENADDQVLREVAQLLEYPYVDRLLTEIVVANREEHEPQSEWEMRFRLGLS